MTPEELRAIRERCEAATPGPWRVYGSEFDEDCREHLAPYGLEDSQERLIWSSGGGEYSHPDMETAQFIASARTDVPALLDEVDRLRSIHPSSLTDVLTALEDDRDAAIRERDEARAEVERLSAQMDCLQRSHDELFDAQASVIRERDEARAEVERLTRALRRYGFRECDVAECNCGSWHGGGREQREAKP